MQVGDDLETGGNGVSIDYQGSSDFDVGGWNEFDVNLGVLRVADALFKVKVGGEVDASGGSASEVQLQGETDRRGVCKLGVQEEKVGTEFSLLKDGNGCSWRVS